MAYALLQQGATAVLAWRDKVEDRDAIQAAATLYGNLAAGNPVIAALAATYRHLLSQNIPSWHLLQLYVGDTLPEALVTPINTPGRETIRKQSSRERFFDADGQVKVVSREYFVGRRRELQQCLQALQSNETIGVLIYGMGGVGKSSLAARLCDRLVELEPVVLVGTANESRLTPQLTPWLPSQNQSSMDSSFDQLSMSTMGMAGGGFTASQPQNQSLSLLQILMKIATNKQPLLLVFDDFESNLVASENRYTLKPGTADLLRKLVTAIRESNLPHRILITSRCSFSFPEAEAFFQLPLASLQGVEWQKKCQYVQYFYRNAAIPQSIRDRALQLAGGNPRLLEGFYQILAEANPENLENLEPLLQKLEQTAAELRADSFVTELFSRQPVALQNMLKLASVYPLPVPKPIFAAICSNIHDFERHFQQAVALGLVEKISQPLLSHPGKSPVTQNLYSVSSVLRWQWESQLEKQHYRRAAGFLYNYWWQLEPKSRLTYGKIHQLHRLSLAGECQEIAVEVTQKTAAAYNRFHYHREAANICQQTLSVFPDTRITLQLINAKRCLNQIDEAEKLSQQLIDACRSDNQRFLAYILIENSRLKFVRGDWEQAVRNLQKALEIGDRDGNPIVQIRTRCMLSFFDPSQTNRDRSSDFIEEALDILNENKNSLPNWQEYANNVFMELGWTRYKQGNNQQAYQNFSKVWSASRQNNQISWEAMSLLGMAMVELEYKRLDRSKNYCYEALEHLKRLNDKPQQAMVWNILTLIFAGYQDVEKATECSRRCLEICEEINLQTMAEIIAGTHATLMVQIELHRQNWQGVLYFYEKAAATCTSSQSFPQTMMVAEMKKEIVKVAAENKDTDANAKMVYDKLKER
jgi:tetratricopeptide (TPR) repeat protein